MTEIRVLRRATVLAVLLQRYVSETREDRSDFALKAKLIREELGEVYDRLTIRWAAAVIGQNETNFFTTRIVR